MQAIKSRSPSQRQPGLLAQVRDAIRTKHYSIRTEEAYAHWIRRFILFHGKRHPRDMGVEEIRQFITDLAVTQHVAASTQNQALSALLFLYKVVLRQDVDWIDGIIRAKKSRRLPVVLSREEVKGILQDLSELYELMASLLYGSGLRLMECLRLRVKDVDFSYQQITVRDGKGAQDRFTVLPGNIMTPLQAHLQTVKRLHEYDLAAGFGHVYLPYALARKYPNAASEWGWQYLFPAAKRSIDPRSGVERRHHLTKSVLSTGLHPMDKTLFVILRRQAPSNSSMKRHRFAAALRLPSWLVKMMQVSLVGYTIQTPILTGPTDEKRVAHHLHQVEGEAYLAGRWAASWQPALLATTTFVLGQFSTVSQRVNRLYFAA